MEKKKPELDLPLPDQETFERVWRRVMPNQDLSPVAVGSPEQAADQEAVNAPGIQTPPSSSQTQEDGELLLALMDQALAGISGAQALTRRMGSRARQLSELSTDHQQAMRRLSALYYLLTGQRCPPRPAVQPREFLPVSQALREQYLWERGWCESCLEGARQARDSELRGLLEDLAQDGILHSRAIRSTLERMGSSSAS